MSYQRLDEHKCMVVDLTPGIHRGQSSNRSWRVRIAHGRRLAAAGGDSRRLILGKRPGGLARALQVWASHRWLLPYVADLDLLSALGAARGPVPTGLAARIALLPAHLSATSRPTPSDASCSSTVKARGRLVGLSRRHARSVDYPLGDSGDFRRLAPPVASRRTFVATEGDEWGRQEARRPQSDRRHACFAPAPP